MYVAMLCVVGFCVFHISDANQQADSGSVDGQPRTVHAPSTTRLHRSSADESSDEGGETGASG